MDKKSKETIKEVIEVILNFRQHELDFNTNFVNPLSDTVEEDEAELARETMKKFDIPLVKLNNLLTTEERYTEVIEIEKQMKKIQSKKYITVKEFTDIYNTSKTSQQNYRGRMHDPLPYHQKVAGGKIVYVVDEVEKWFENQHK